MVNVNDENFSYSSMPIHNPLYKIESVHFRGEIIKNSLTVEKPEVIANIVPEPLIYNDNKIHIILNINKGLGGLSGPKEDSSWNEISIQIPVTYNDEPGHYICEIYSNNISGVIMNREVFGYPRIPGLVSVEKNGKNYKAGLADYISRRDILNLNFNLPKKNPVPEGHASGKKSDGAIFRKMPKVILFKYISSVVSGNRPDVKQLVEMKYKKPVIYKHIMGEGNIELLEGAPGYLKEAGIAKINESIYMDMEINIIGGEVLHDYL